MAGGNTTTFLSLKEINCHICECCYYITLHSATYIFCCYQVEMRNLTMNQWSLKPGQIVLLQLSELYLSLIWETTVLHSCCTEYLCDKVGSLVCLSWCNCFSYQARLRSKISGCAVEKVNYPN